MSPESRARSIAVLPFVNMSSDPRQEWFSDGLTEEILNALARTPDLLVAARTSSFQYKDRNIDVSEIAKALGVDHILEGSVRRSKDRLRVTAQLIRASDGFHLWSEVYDGTPDDVIELQEEVAIAIAVALETAMDPDALAEMVSSGTSSVPAYNAYLEGLAQNISTFSTGDVYDFVAARDAFELAIEHDPEFALAHWKLAQFWEIQLRPTNIIHGSVDVPTEEMQNNFDEAIENAIRFERDPALKSRYQAFHDAKNLRMAQALRANTEYLEQRPNDREQQNLQLELLAVIGSREQLRQAIQEFDDRDGHDPVILGNSITFTLIVNDPEFISDFCPIHDRQVPGYRQSALPGPPGIPLGWQHRWRGPTAAHNPIE